MGRKKRPAITPQERENELIMLAYDVAEQRLRDGSASSQIVTQLLKAGSSRDELEKARIEQSRLLDAAKIDGMESQARIEALFEEAKQALTSYRGGRVPVE